MVSRIKELCAKNGITVLTLETDLSFAKNSIYKWDINSPSSDRLKKVADYFGVSTDYLLGRTDNPAIISGVINIADPRKDQLSPDEQAAVDAFLEAWRKNREK